jgi:hypothetical protein
MWKTMNALALGALLLAGASCTPAEGERCNPLRFNDECGSGLQCTYPKGCGVAYCCPPADKITPQTVSTCQACPLPDAGAAD